MERDYRQLTKIFKALADKTRLEIVEMLAREELCACNILERFCFTQPTLSYHLKILTDCGLVEGTREGAMVRYALRRDELTAVCDLFGPICASRDSAR